MSKIKNSGLDQYGAEPFEQQQFETAGVEAVNASDDDDDLKPRCCVWPAACVVLMRIERLVDVGAECRRSVAERRRHVA